MKSISQIFFRKLSTLFHYINYKLVHSYLLYNLKDKFSLELIVNKYKANYKNIIIPFKNALPLKKFEENPILSEGERGMWDELGIREPYLFYDGNQYFIYYESFTESNKLDWQIGVATAPKITGPWKKYEKNPILRYTKKQGDFDKQCIADPCVIYKDGLYHIWFDMYDGKYWRLGKAYSENGLDWKKLTNNQGKTSIVLDLGKKRSWDYDNVHCPEVFIWNDRFHLLYGCKGIGHIGFDTGLALQKDVKGERFEKWGLVTTDGLLKNEDISSRLQAGIKINGILISGIRTIQDDNIETTYMIFSDDGGKSWNKLSDPILNAGSNNSWDKSLYYGPNTWLISDDKLWTAYLGGKRDPIRKLGLAYMEIPDFI